MTDATGTRAARQQPLKKRPQMPTPRQLALAADTLRRYRLAAKLSPQDDYQIQQAEHMIGFHALAMIAKEDDE